MSCFEDLGAYRLVGASACADRVTTAMVTISVESENTGRGVRDDLIDAGRLFCDLKPDTALYRNVVTMLTRTGNRGRAEDVKKTARRLADHRHAAQASVVNQAQMLLADIDTLLVHDYSSTVMSILQGLGVTRPRRVDAPMFCQAAGARFLRWSAGLLLTGVMGRAR